MFSFKNLLRSSTERARETLQRKRLLYEGTLATARRMREGEVAIIENGSPVPPFVAAIPYELEAARLAEEIAELEEELHGWLGRKA